MFADKIQWGKLDSVSKACPPLTGPAAQHSHLPHLPHKAGMAAGRRGLHSHPLGHSTWGEGCIGNPTHKGKAAPLPIPGHNNLEAVGLLSTISGIWSHGLGVDLNLAGGGPPRNILPT